MVQLMPAKDDSHVHEAFNNEIFSDVKSFIKLYNEGIINHRNERISELAELVVDTYKNVELKGNSFVFIAPAEVAMNELEELFDKWRTIVRLKRELLTLREEGLIGDVFYFVDGKGAGFVHAPGEVAEDGTQEISRVGKERMPRIANLKAALPEHVWIESGEDSVAGNVDAVLGIDDSVLIRAREQFN